MLQYIKIAKRHTGMGLKITKFHQLRHWFFYISMYGVPRNYDSSFCESHHSYHTKRTGRRTQKRQESMLYQTAMLVMDRMTSLTLHSNDRDPSISFVGDAVGGAVQMELGGAAFLITLEYVNIDEHHGIHNILHEEPVVKFTWVSKRDRHRRGFPPLCIQALGEKLSWFNNGDHSKRLIQIRGRTELKVNDVSMSRRKRICCNPDYRRQGPWFDWVNIAWLSEDVDEGENVILPAQVQFILDFDHAIYEDVPQHMNELELMDHDPRVGIHLLVHSASMPVEEDNTSWKSLIATNYEMENVMQIVSVTSIDSPVLVARDVPFLHFGRNPVGTCLTYTITALTPSSEWSDCF